MTLKLTAKGGPLHGKTVIVADTTDTFTHHGDEAGHYKAHKRTATWHAAQPSTAEDE